MQNKIQPTATVTMIKSVMQNYITEYDLVAIIKLKTEYNSKKNKKIKKITLLYHFFRLFVRI